MSRFLEHRAAASRRRARTAHEAGTSGLDARAKRARAPRPLTLDPTFDLIAEIKLRSPAEGTLHETNDDWRAELTQRAQAYAAGGAAVLSVLTEPDEFGGSLEHLEVVAGAVALPVMRKDFLVDEVQILEARAYGASGVLLIARMLPGPRLEALTRCALDHGLFVLLEAFDASDLKRIGALVADMRFSERYPVLVGLNARDLTTLQVDTQRLLALAGEFPSHLPAVAESGLESPRDAAEVAAAGYRLALVGSALMRSEEPAQLIGAMTAAARGEP